MFNRKNTKNTATGKDKSATRDGSRSRKISRIRGMKDVLADEYKYWDLVIKKATELCRAYSFNRLDTPVLEPLALYEKTIGKDSEVFSKQLYSFADRGADKLAMRPEATPSLMRCYAEHAMFNSPQPTKIFWIGPVFRYDKMQSGSYRQFHQFSLQVFGEEGHVADFLSILIAYNFFRELQINVQIHVNSLGCESCRGTYSNKLLNFYGERGKKSKLCNECKKDIKKSPLRLLKCEDEKCIKLREDAPQMVDYLCEPCKNHFVKVLEYLDELDVPYHLDPHLIKNFDYYNRTIFEIWATEDDMVGGKSKYSLGGGGRYDSMVAAVGGKDTPACGFSLGLERTILKIKEKNIPLKKDSESIIFIAQLGEQARRKSLSLFEELRRAGFHVRQSFTRDSLKAQLEDAAKADAKISLILGHKEMIDNTVLIRDMEHGVQEVVDYKKIRAEIEKRFKRDLD